ncbi:molybdopterin-guanine dinucleotide biosynthesis protein B [Paenibacillus sp. DCT19]|uniref:molybdopterin-guanine dinucleotide biosynthesis protein B n=1 Tax=Paenibacillus sp. DCT19 TaxID=2211212 RepID=UPI000FE26095|nr:molybdopterin-guanine dinucleotide biosynthesis protein B [Paenibacillus sp. DCT19]
MSDIRTNKPHIVQIVGYKNSGKSTLTAALTKQLTLLGRRVAVIKHDGHDHFQMDHEGTDSFNFTSNGASAIVVMSATRTAIIEQRATELREMIEYLSEYDWILIEGHKQAAYPKLLMIREPEDLSLYEQLQGILAVVTRVPLMGREDVTCEQLVWHDIQETEHIGNWLVQRIEGI